MNRFLLRSAIALTLFVALVVLRVKEHYPSLPVPLRVELKLDPGEAGRADPLIVAGRVYRGDFLSVHFDDPNTVHFLYDSWGHPGIPSRKVSVRPGESLRLAIEMPALNQVQGRLSPPSQRVRVICNNETVLDVKGHFFMREQDRIFFGENSLGGTACGTTLRGQIIDEQGRILRGGPENISTHRERLIDWLAHHPRQVGALILFSLCAAFYGERLRFLVPRLPLVMTSVRRHRWFVGATMLAGIFYAWLVTGGSFVLNYSEIFGSFYDYQAESLLYGRLDVPEGAIGAEAFEARGKLYGYFGPTPALLRLPFVVSGFAFGTLSRFYMLAYFVASLIASYLILCHALKIARTGRGQESNDVPSPFAVFVLVGSVGLGSTIFFLGSRGLIFHEAILGGIAFALWSCWCAVRHWSSPADRWWIGALACGVLSIHTRPPTGLFALTLLGCVTVAIAVREWRTNHRVISSRIRHHIGIGVLCATGVLSLNALAWLKFRTFDAAPLRISRPYTEPGRLERIDGKSFHLVNLPYNFDTYILRPNFRVEARFPWIYLVSHRPRRDFPKAKIDLPDHTLALPYAMPSLFLLATLGCAAAAFALPTTRAPIAALWTAALPMTLALFAAVATAQRYTGDFCPFLISAATFGLAAVELTSSGWGRIARSIVVLATVSAMAVTIAITLHYQGDTLWGVPDQTRIDYQQLRQRVDAWFGHENLPPTGK